MCRYVYKLSLIVCNSTLPGLNALHSKQCPKPPAGADQMSYSDKTSQTNHKAQGTLAYQQVCLKWSVGKPPVNGEMVGKASGTQWYITMIPCFSTCCLSNGKNVGCKPI